MSATFVRRGVTALALGTGALLLIVGINSLHWIGTTFPGFFVVPNRVVPSIALPEWADGNASRFFQHQVVAIDGVPVTTAREVYAAAAADRTGRPLTYTFRRPDGGTFVAVVSPDRFSIADWLLVFGAYLFTGLAFIGPSLLVVLLVRTPASFGLLASGLVTGIFAISAADLYGPHWFVRLHVLAESLLAPSYVHLALVFPRERLAWRRRPILATVYLAFLVLAAVYECVLPWPSAYTTMHLAVTAMHGGAAALIIVLVAFDLVRSHSPLVRRRVGVVLLGVLGAFLVPGVLMGASALLGGKVPVNAAAFTAFLFPLSLGYAIVQQDLFEIDVLLRRAVTYAVVLVLIALVYFGILFSVVMPARSLAAQSPLVLALINLGLLFLIAPVRARVQDAVDRVFFRRDYDAEQALSSLSQTLVTAHTTEQVIARTDALMASTACPLSATLFLWGPGGRLVPAGPAASSGEHAMPPELAVRIERGELLSYYEYDDGSGRPAPPIWQALSAELLVPIGEAPMALLAIGGKASGHPYSIHDIVFLRAVASQLALALANADAFARLEKLNASLERQVEERTAWLEQSLAELREAYQQLERNQKGLVRADRLATLGRLTAGIAHEVNTPLGAVINSLKLLTDLGREYADSIDDPRVTPEDHREIARELLDTTDAAASWARTAAAFINRVRMHGRDPRTGDTARVTFKVSELFAEIRALLAHRVRAASCRLEIEDEDAITLAGDQTRLAQVLVNLLTNALDAYEDARVLDGRIEVRARRANGQTMLSVRDWAGGIPADLLPHIFEELFTTKEPGRGTGLGLWIARNLVEQSFGGTLGVDVEPGVGSCFTITLPVASGSLAPAPDGRGPDTAVSAAS